MSFYIVSSRLCICGKYKCAEPNITLYGPYDTSEKASQDIEKFKEYIYSFETNLTDFFTVKDMSKDVKSPEQAKEYYRD